MSRLTRKIKGYYSVDLRTCLPMEYEQIENSNACVDKLGKLEDIEEELGIDLITLFKIIKQKYVYTNSFNKRVEQFVLTKIDGIEKDYLERNYLKLDFQEVEYDENGNEIDSIVHWIPDTKDYGKTWALTKEELENEKDNI